MRSLALVLTLIPIYSFAAAAYSVPPAALPFHLTPQGGIIVRVLLDGAGRVPFMVDTGSNGSAISETLAASLGLPIVARTTVTSAIGQKPRLVARIEHFVMGGLLLDGVLATVTPDDDLAPPDAASGADRVQGIVGQDVLAALRYTIDYRARRIVWRTLAGEAPRSAAVLTLEPRDDRFLAVLPQGESTLRLVPDSGSEGFVFFQHDGRRPPRMTFTAERVAISGVAGSAEAQLARLDTLRIGPTTLTDVPVVVVECAPAAQTSDGLLPLHIFARVTFNGPERQLVIERR